MTLRDLLIVYLAIGIGCALWIYKRAPPPAARALVSAAVAVPLWPLWAPFALDSRSRAGASHPLSLPVERALHAVEAARIGTSAAALLSPEVTARLRREVARIAERLGELDRLLASEGFDLESSARRLEALERAGDGSRLSSARVHHQSLKRLYEQRAADAAGLSELADLVLALRAQLLLERQGAASEGVADLIRECWTRLEALDEASQTANLR